MKKIYSLLFVLLCYGATVHAQTTVILSPVQDNTMFSESGATSNGSGEYLFAGRTLGMLGTDIRRALVLFDLSSIPAGVLITNVSLELTGSNGGPNLVELHTLTNNWGEGSSDASGQEGMGTAAVAGDATWTQNVFGTSSWTTMGGDYTAISSASASIQAGQTSNFTSVSLIDDVQDWIDGILPNHGWILVGDETSLGTAVRMNSRENANDQPSLSITYTAPTPRVVLNEVNETGQWVEIYNPNAVSVDINNWFLCNRPSYGKIGTAAVSLISGALNMPAGSYTVLSWSGIESTTPAELGLYRINTYNNPSAIEDYVQYNGVASPSRASVAVAAGVWGNVSDFVPAFNDGSGSSIGLQQHSFMDGTASDLDDWFVQVPTQGQLNVDCLYNVFQSGFIGTGTYEASNELGSDVVILNPRDVTFHAGRQIELVSPFEVRLGAQFLASISLCQ